MPNVKPGYCRLCEWTGRIKFDTYYQATRPSLSAAAQYCHERGFEVSRQTIMRHTKHSIAVRPLERRLLPSETITRLVKDYGIVLDRGAVDTAIEYQQQILSEIITILGLKTLVEVKDSAERGTMVPRSTIESYAAVLTMFAKVTSIDNIVNINAASATMDKYHGKARPIEAIEDPKK